MEGNSEKHVCEREGRGLVTGAVERKEEKGEGECEGQRGMSQRGEAGR